MKVQGYRCPRCNDEIWSRYTHDMRYCLCGYCFVDGGRSYFRAGYGGEEFPKPWEQPEVIEIEIEAKK